MSRRKSRKKEENVFYSVLIGALICGVIMFISSLICAIFVNMSPDPLSLTGISSLITLLISAAVSGFTVSKRSRQSKMLTASLSSLLFCLVLLLIGLAVSAGAISGRVFLNYVCYMGVAILFAKLGARGKKRKHRA